MRESDAACLVVSAAMHSGRGHFLRAMTPATPALLTWSGLPAPEEAVFAVGTGPLRGKTQGWEEFFFGGGLEWAKTLQNAASVFACKTCVKVDMLCMCVNSSCEEERACRIFQREKAKRAFPEMKFLASLKLRVQLEHFSLPPPSLPPPFRPPSLPPLLPRLSFFLRFYLVVFFYPQDKFC